MFKKRQQYFTKIKEVNHVSNGKYYDTSNDELPLSEERKGISAELKFALISFYVSFVIVVCKLILINKTPLQNAYVHGKKFWSMSSFGTYTILSDDNKEKLSELLVTSNDTVKDFLSHFNWLLLPLFAGVGMTAITWYMIYIDSCIPGIRPPTPFSPNKNTIRPTPRFHMGYIVAIMNGLLIFLLLVFSWN